MHVAPSLIPGLGLGVGKYIYLKRYMMKFPILPSSQLLSLCILQEMAIPKQVHIFLPLSPQVMVIMSSILHFDILQHIFLDVDTWKAFSFCSHMVAHYVNRLLLFVMLSFNVKQYLPVVWLFKSGLTN